MHRPFCGRFAFRAYVAASGASLERTVNATQIHPARAGVRNHGPGRRLFEVDVTASGVAFEPSGDTGGVNVAAPSFGMDIAGHVLDLDLTRSGVCPHGAANVGDLNAPRASLDFCFPVN